MDNNNNKREKIIIFILGAVLIIAVLSIIAIFSSAIMRLLGFEYESVGGFILYFIIASIVSYPMNLVAGAFPKALLNLDRITREMAVCMYVLLDTIAAVVMAVRVGAYKGLVAGEMLGAKLLAQLLRPVYGQTVVRAVPWVKADDIVVAFHIFPPLVLLIAEICPHTGNGKILPAAVQRGQPVVLAGDKPAGFIKDGLHGKLVMLKEKILLGGSVVGVFRVDMLECCQPRHLLS